MIIRDRRKGLLARRILLVVIPLALIAGGIYALLPPTLEETFPDYFCDAETLAKDTEYPAFEGRDGVIFGDGVHQSKDMARSGMYSCAPHPDAPWGMTLIIKDLQPGERYQAKVWCSSQLDEGNLVIHPSWGKPFSGHLTGQKDGEWVEIINELEVPYFAGKAEAKFYVMRTGKEKVYFDDFAIKRLPGNSREEMALLPMDSLRTINLVIEPAAYAKLEAKRDEAMVRGLLFSEDDDWVKARLEEGENNYPVKLRLKGDWTDHLKGDKWSYRIALREGKAWNGMTVFSVQSPATRSFLMEWVFHQWLRNEGLLSPRYDFLQLTINGESRGIYAFEEHFARQLPESSERREGPILKFVEDGLWEAEEKWVGADHPDMDQRVPRYISAETGVFSQDATLGDTVLSQQFDIANNLMHAYKHGLKEPGDLFDLDKLARYYAIADLCKAHHAFIWHNQRFYYNPIISKLEPIGYDAYTATGPFAWVKKPFVGYARNFRYMAPAYKALMFERFFADPEFVAYYVKALNRFSDPEYIGAFLLAMDPELKKREKMIGREWAGYVYDRDFLQREAENIRLMVYPLANTSVKAYQGGQTDKGQHFQVFNYHCLPVLPIGIGETRERISPFQQDSLLPSYAEQFPPEMVDLYSQGTGSHLYFEVPGLDSIFEVEILPFAAPGTSTPEQDLFADIELQTNDIYEIQESDQRIVFRTGKHQVSEDLIFPKGYELIANPGTELDLIKGAKFISKSNMNFQGTEASPIVIRSSDGTGMGLTLLQALDGRKSDFRYVVFEGLRNMTHKGWSQTGAVSVYESEVTFNHCRFVSNQSEDGLNIVRSIFTLSNCFIGNTFSDGFDSDFSTGTLENCVFERTGNDAMDFSGGNIYVTSAYVDGAGDKGISFGERCKGVVVKVDIRNSVVGVASKDFSDATLNHLVLDNVQEGLLAYQKKPEFGPATMTIHRLDDTGVGQLYRIQEGSTVTLEGQQIKGKW